MSINEPENVVKKESEIIVNNKGQITIPVRLRWKYKIDEGTRLQVVEMGEGILLKPKMSIWDKVGMYSAFGTPQQVKEELDKIRHEEENE